MPRASRNTTRSGHTLVELVAAMVSSTVLLAGLAGVMFIAREIAYTPTASEKQVQAFNALNQLVDELRCARIVTELSPTAITFVVADRDGDQAAERIRYHWSGTPGAPLIRTAGNVSVLVIASIERFDLVANIATQVESLATTVESPEALLLAGPNLTTSESSGITANYWLARRIDPSQFPNSIGSILRTNAKNWNVTRVTFHARNLINPNAGYVIVQLRATGSPNDGPTSHVLGGMLVQEASISPGFSSNNVAFSPAVQGLAFDRIYSLVWEGDPVTAGNHALIVSTTSGSPGNVSVSTNGGASWALAVQSNDPKDLRFELYGTYSGAGLTRTLTRQHVEHVAISVRTDGTNPSSLDIGVALPNEPELVSAYWRLNQTDFAANPTAIDIDGNATPDWATVNGTLQSRPLNDFTGVTVIDFRCRATGSGGDVLRINADRQSGLYAPVILRLQAAAGIQTLTLLGKPSDTAETTLHTVDNLSNDPVRVRLVIIPQFSLVHLQVNGQDVSGFTYPRYAPSGNDRCLTLYPSNAQFEYVDVRLPN